VVGDVLSQVVELIKDHRLSKHEKEARKAAHRDAQVERRNAVERQTLLELQEAVMKVANTTTALRSAELSSDLQLREQNIFPNDVDLLRTANKGANAQIDSIGVRVRDEAVRALLQQLRGRQ
jgi:hypothetical protein